MYNFSKFNHAQIETKPYQIIMPIDITENVSQKRPRLILTFTQVISASIKILIPENNFLQTEILNQQSYYTILTIH